MLGVTVITAIIKALPKLLSIIGSVGFWVGVANSFIDAIKQAIFGLGDAFAALFSGDFGSGIVDGMNSTITEIKKSISGVSDQLFALVGDEGKSMAADVGASIAEATSKSTTALSGAWNKIVASWYKAGDAITKAWYDTGDFLNDAGDKIAATFVNAGKVLTEWGDKIAATFVKIGDDLTKIFTDLGDKIAATGTKIWEGIKTGLDTIGSYGTKIWDGLKSSLDGAASVFTSIGTKIWEGLSAGIGSAGNTLSRLFQFDGGGKGAVENFIGLDFPFVKFAQGGLVPGRASVPGDSLSNDRVPALLSPGEIVLPRSVLGDEAFKKLVMAKLAGQEIPQFAMGGSLGSIVKAVKEASTPITDLLKGAVSGVTSAVVPKEIQALFDPMARFGSVDIVKLVKDPMSALQDALRSNLDAFKPYFQKMVKARGFADGGFVNPSDTVPAMLTPGEFVLNRNAVDRIGLSNLMGLNNGGSMSGANNYNVTLNIKTEQPIDESFVRNKLMPEIERSLRRSSLDGRRMLSPAGVR
jgi:hypothetical protein